MGVVHLDFITARPAAVLIDGVDKKSAIRVLARHHIQTNFKILEFGSIYFTLVKQVATIAIRLDRAIFNRESFLRLIDLPSVQRLAIEQRHKAFFHGLSRMHHARHQQQRAKRSHP